MYSSTNFQQGQSGTGFVAVSGVVSTPSAGNSVVMVIYMPVLRNLPLHSRSMEVPCSSNMDPLVYRVIDIADADFCTVGER